MFALDQDEDRTEISKGISIFIATRLANRIGVEWAFVFSGLMALSTLPWAGYLNEAFAHISQPTAKVGMEPFQKWD